MLRNNAVEAFPIYFVTRQEKEQVIIKPIKVFQVTNIRERVSIEA